MSRSPFTGMSKGDLAKLRTLAVAVGRWERSMKAGHFSWQPESAWMILGNEGGFWQARVLDTLRDRAWGRIRACEHWPKLQEAYRLEHMRRYEPQAYEVRMLREKLARHIEACEELK